MGWPPFLAFAHGREQMLKVAEALFGKKWGETATPHNTS